MNQTSYYSESTTASVIHQLLQSPLLLPEDHVQENVIPTILGTIVADIVIYCLVFYLIVHRLIPTDGKKDNLVNRRKLAYQMTNGITNTVIGVLGLYHHYWLVPQEASTQQRIEGLHELYMVGACQIGFQFWSIVMAMFWVEESTQMLIHHVAVILASTMSVFLTNGFRYFAPLGLGMTELSSVPLSVMNAFKDNAAWQKASPGGFLASRLVFALAFLVIRIVIFTPQCLEYLRLSFLVTYWADTEHVGLLYRTYMGITWMGSVFLLCLQFYWAGLIVNGLSKFALAKVQVKSQLVDKKKL